jgi:toxin ParE1/3/4
MRVIWSGRALERVEQIADYIAQDSVTAAAAWVDELFAQVEKLAEFPEMGKPGRGIATPGIRELIIGDFRVFYEVGSDIDIHSVWRASQPIDEDELTSGD